MASEKGKNVVVAEKRSASKSYSMIISEVLSTAIRKRSFSFVATSIRFACKER